ncbi:D-alanyl-D-alanine endopeptidase [Agitococcus lubricus]|uniref:D-alanyl-D-alanine endopeptidase (Penicillin-binding protein 7) n=1 Tax=Agitococcus lubricus TaxID=1077255 RepID=A0A2T5IXD5_9GAMM|nr:D-alanyl-D-alanine endopeptidase [Agitococcus lubricus]PTQ88524.1 D-alanyl-D-alanine endopeptidase (penicillin-binding protein 7) [Agitococcus lubricus]
MINVRPALLSSLVLGLMLALTPVSHAVAKEQSEKQTVKQVKEATNKKATANKKSNKADKAKVAAKDKKAKKEKELAKNSKSKTNIAKKSAKTDKVAKRVSKAEREALRKERTRERLAKVSRTGKIAKAAKYAAKPVVIASAATATAIASAPAVANVPKANVIQQTPNAVSALNVESRAALVMNAETGEVLYSKNTEQSMPIASITKLMTVMVVLDAHLPLDEPITISEEDIDRLKNTTSRLSVGTVLSRAELMLLALMSSENRAASALARSYPGGTAAAIAAMNRKANAIGMKNTHFYDGTGLSSSNMASPKDLVAMVKAAHSYPLIRRFSTTSEHAVAIRDRVQQFHNTNSLVKNPDWQIGVSKTGYINEAGKCLVMQAKIKTTPVVIVLMDSWGKYTRIGDAQRVKKWLENVPVQ